MSIVKNPLDQIQKQFSNTNNTPATASVLSIQHTNSFVEKQKLLLKTTDT